VRGISLFLDQLAEHCPDIRALWMIGERADDEALGSCGPFGWDLLAFADAETLDRLREATDLHRSDIRLRVVVDGDRFEPAWGDPALAGSLSEWRWRRVSELEAFYSSERLETVLPRQRAVRLSEGRFTAFAAARVAPAAPRDLVHAA